MQPQSPNHDFDFMLQNGQPAKKSIPTGGLPKPALYALAGLVLIIVAILVFSLFSNRNKTNNQPFLGVLQRNTETLRVTNLVQDKFKLQDPQIQALASTVESTFTSDNTQLNVYLKHNNTFFTPLQINADTDKTTDATLQTASQNNNLDVTYVTYLKSALSKYKTDIQLAAKSAGPNGLKLLQAAYKSADTLLSEPPLKS